MILRVRVIFYIILVFFMFENLVQANMSQKLGSPIMLSISKDALYVAITQSDRNAYLFDLKNHSIKKINDEDINVYSIGFIGKTHDIFYQKNKTNDVSIVNLDTGKLLQTFNPHFATYSETINTAMTRFAASENKGLMHIIDMKNPKHRAVVGRPSVAFIGTGTLFQPKFSLNERYIYATNGGGELWIFDAKSEHELKDIIKNVGQTSNALSPNGKYILTADSNSKGLLYDLENHKIVHPFIHGEKMVDPKQPYPLRPITSVNFITDKAYLVTYSGVSDPIVKMGLYRIDRLQADKLDRGTFYSNQMLKAIDLPVYDPKTHKVLPKLTDRYTQIFPSTESYLPEVATNPKKHLLVMAQANGNGIMVYKYDPKKESLKLLWAPQIK